jgi:hypothetical protein
MRAAAGLIGLFLLASVTGADAQSRDPSDRALGTEMNRDRAETRIERLRQERTQQERDERATTRGERDRARAQGAKPKPQQP